MSNNFQHKVLIREHHLDMLGHVNNATYLELYEEARWEFLSERGFNMDRLIKEKIGPVIIEAHIKYKKEIKLRETIVITFEILGYDKKIGQMKQTMINTNNEICSEAIFVFGLFDLKARKLLTPTKEWNDAIGYNRVI
ncbi:acyl-CoA thioesterase [Dolichospermum sp. ST_sed1]|nr:acyl-CoA thioesterase [Dolichospermum sp. ST_sed1]